MHRELTAGASLSGTAPPVLSCCTIGDAVYTAARSALSLRFCAFTAAAARRSAVTAAASAAAAACRLWHESWVEGRAERVCQKLWKGVGGIVNYECVA